MGVSNQQTAIPFNNSNANYISGTGPSGSLPNRHPSVSPPCYMNAPNHLIPLQNNGIASPHMRSVGPTVHSGQSFGGFGPRNCAPNVNPMGQILNQSCHFQPPGQLFMPNSMSLAQNFSQNAGFPNSQFGFGNPMQNANHLLSMQPNHGHVFPYNTLGHPNQVSQSMGPQNPLIITTHPFHVRPNGVGQNLNQNQHMPKYGQAFPCNALPSLNPSLGHENNVSQSMAPQNPAVIANPSSVVHSNGAGQCRSNHGQPVPCNALGHPNQVAQSVGPPNSEIVANPPFSTAYTNDVGQHIGQMHVNASSQPLIFAQNLQGNMATPPFCAIQPQQTHNMLLPHLGSQVNSVNSSYKSSPSKNFSSNTQRNLPSSDMQKSHIHHKQKMKGKSGFPSKNERKGSMNEKAGKYDRASVANQARGEQRRSLSLSYTEREIQQWKEERRKNYPSNVNVEKKLRQKLTDSEAINQDAKVRRQQLKEILAKQAELGFEVPEIPARYLSDSENQVHKTEDDKEMSKKGKFRNKHNRRGRRNQNDRFAKKRMANTDTNNSPNKKQCLNQRKPTLLQKLLTRDIKRDRNHLLQVFRFVAMNSFLKDWPEKPLKLPSVIVKETGCSADMVEDKSRLMEEGVPAVDMKSEEGEIAE